MPSKNYGIKLKYLSTPPSTFTEVSGVIYNLTGLDIELDNVDTTNHAGNGYKESEVTLLGFGDVSFDMDYVPGSNQFRNWAVSRTKNTYQVEYPNGETATFVGIITGFSPNSEIGEVSRASVTIKVTGAVTYASV